MHNANLNSFLYLGYFLNSSVDNYPVSLSKISHVDSNLSEFDLIGIGSNILRLVVSDSFSLNSKHLVPISGGLDSRALLACLLEHTDASNISTYTFGTPNTVDYDIGLSISKKIGTKHVSFPLTEYTYTQDKLMDISRRVNQQTVLFHHGPVDEIIDKFSGHITWSGFMGEVLSGDHIPSYKSKNLDQAKGVFLKSNRYTKSLKLINSYDNLFDAISHSEGVNKIISYEEELDIYNRQSKYIAPHVLMDGLTYKTPFTDSRWVDFILSVGERYRNEQYLYKKILLDSFPYLFSFPAKCSFGQRLDANKASVLSNRIMHKIRKMANRRYPNILNPHINYIDFDDAIRNRSDVKSVIYENIMDLNNRKIVDWIDIVDIWKNHQSKNGNYSDVLMTLASLEIHLKTGMKI